MVCGVKCVVCSVVWWLVRYVVDNEAGGVVSVMVDSEAGGVVWWVVRYVCGG